MVLQGGGNLSVEIGGIDGAAWEYEAIGHEPMTGAAQAHQHLGSGVGFAQDEQAGCGAWGHGFVIVHKLSLAPDGAKGNRPDAFEMHVMAGAVLWQAWCYRHEADVLGTAQDIEVDRNDVVLTAGQRSDEAHTDFVTARSDRIAAEQVGMLYSAGPPGIVGAMIAAFTLAAIVETLDPKWPVEIAVWIAFVIVVVAAHLLIVRAYRRAETRKTRWRFWAQLFAALSFAEGLIWAAVSFYATGPGEFEVLLVTLLFVCSVCAGAVPAFGTHLPSFILLFVTASAPFAITCLRQPDAASIGLVSGVVLFDVTFLLIGKRANKAVVENLRLRFENIDLAADLLRQKEAADEANVAKSRFLAAASHDLRQPVHALSLFVGALRGHQLPHEVGRLVEHIESSVVALDSLFTALLDISRLDAGVVEPRLQSIALHPLFERLERDFAAEARTRGIGLRFHRCSLPVRTDLQLLERILRNLISNAIKYTDRGRVVVGCRRGPSISLQVWDTGRGIPGDRIEDVFEEFYQLHNPERDRSKGLGLGLAIVRRLTLLLDHPLTLKSVVGRGSVFSLSLPIATAVDTVSPPLQAASGGLYRGFILVIDDEAAIQEAMRSLLTSWGHEVMSAGSGAEMLDRISDCPRQPDLIICDYRLRGGENGIAAIRQLQFEYNDEIPALLITGDTASDRLNEARDSGFLLLHKPVQNSRLRAAISNLMTRTDSAAEV